MKTYLAGRLLPAMIFLCTLNNANAQADLNTEFASRMNYVFGQMEKSRVPTGLLLDYAMEFADLRSYNGVLADSNKTNAGLLKDIYSTVVMSGIHTNAGGFHHPDYVDSLWQTHRQPGIITLSGLYYRYSRFRDDALSSGLVTVSNDQIYDKYYRGNWINPYQTEVVFAMSPPLHRYNRRNMQVRLPSGLWSTNSTSDVSTIEVNFNDGIGYQTVRQNTLYNVNYRDSGTKTWVFRLNLNNGTSLYSHTEMYIEQGSSDSASRNSVARFLRPGGAIALTADQPWNGQFGQGHITVDYANPPDATGRFRLVRPLIVAEGFDPGHLLRPEQESGFTDFSSFLEQIRGSGSVQLRNLLQSPVQQYDIIYVDWDRGSDFLQRNALLLERVIRWVNDEKLADGSTQQNVVLGQSMGGVISRWALRDMEIRGLNHQTRLFISWDAPQQGAYIPVSYQHMARHGSSVFLSTGIPIVLFEYNNIIRPYINLNIQVINGIRGMFGGTPWDEIGSLPSNSQILAGLNLMDVPAARQMLISRINMGGSINNNLHNDWQNELRALGYPVQPRNVAVSNGSECAFDQGFQPGADLLSYDGKASTRVLADFIGQLALPVAGYVLFRPQFMLGILPGRNDMFFEFNCKAQPVNGSGQIYRGKITYRKKVLWLININTTITDRTRYADASVLPLDGAPGGMYDTEQNLSSSEFRNWAIKYNISASSIPHFNFVPVPSALDIGSGNTPLNIADYNARYVGGTPPAPPLNSPFANFTTAFGPVAISNGQVNNNEHHIQISPRNGNLIAEELNGNPNARTNCVAFCAGGQIQGVPTICTQETYTAPLADLATTTYNWTITNNASLATWTTAANTISITRNPGANGVITLRVTITGFCGNVTLTRTVNVGGVAEGSYNYTSNSSVGTSGLGSVSSHFLGAGQSMNFNVSITNTNLANITWTNSGFPVTFTPSGAGLSFSMSAATGAYASRTTTFTASGTSPCGPYSQSYSFTIVTAPWLRFNIITSPNPAKDIVTVKLENEAEEMQHLSADATVIFKLYDFNNPGLARQWKYKNDRKIYYLNIKGLHKGQYVLEVTKDKYRESKQLIIE
jgi:hypothetical protein